MTDKTIFFSGLLMMSAGFAAASAGGSSGAAARITVAADPRVELMSLIFRLAGNKEYNGCRIPSYDADAKKYFEPFKEHPAVRYAAELKKTRGVAYDAVMTMAVHTTDIATLGERVPFSPRPAAMDGRWDTESARKFLALARDFVKDTGFEGFYADHEPLYALAAERMRETLEKELRLEWFDGFFGPAKDAGFHVVLGMFNGTSSYGPKFIAPGGREEIYSILGVWKADGDGKPAFPPGSASTIVHEFIHSYTNPIVDRFSKDLARSGKKIFPLVAREMSAQAYSNWMTLMYETFNRACQLRYTAAFHGPEAVEREEAYEVSRSFHWVPGLGKVLAEYDAEPRRYRDLDEFFPKIKAYLDGYARRAKSEIGAHKEKMRAEAERKRKEMEAWKETGPKIVSMSPENGATDVPADLKVITITFDRGMGGGCSLLSLEGPERYPEVKGGFSYDDEMKVFSIPVELKPGKEYVLGLNGGRFTSFRSAEGVPLYPVVYKFRTRS